jgi:hypothetical protein
MRSLMRNAGGYLLLLAGLLLLFDSSCAVMRPIPRTDYKMTDPCRNKMYRLITRDDREYGFRQFAVTNSTIVILKLESYGRNSWPDDLSRIKTPVVIPWDDVRSLQRAERSNLYTAIWIIVPVVVVGCVACYVYAV